MKRNAFAVLFVLALAAQAPVVLFAAAPSRAQTNGITVENRAKLDANVTVRDASGRTLWSGRIPTGRNHVIKGDCSGGCDLKFQWITGHPTTGNQICETTVSKVAQSDVPNNMLAEFDGIYDNKTGHCSIKRRR